MFPLCPPVCSSALYTAKQVVINLSSTCGPAVSIALFMCLGNSWEVSPHHPVPAAARQLYSHMKRQAGFALETEHAEVCVCCHTQADTCRLVLLAGLVTMLLPLTLMCFFDDDKTLGLLSESLQCALAVPPHVSLAAQCAQELMVVFPRLQMRASQVHNVKHCQWVAQGDSQLPESR
jgi:hypothetical protein